MQDRINRVRQAILSTIRQVRAEVDDARTKGIEPSVAVGFHNGMVAATRHLLMVSGLEMIEPRTERRQAPPSEEEQEYNDLLNEVVESARALVRCIESNLDENPTAPAPGGTVALRVALKALDSFTDAKLEVAGKGEAQEQADAQPVGQVGSSPAPATIQAGGPAPV
jgi:hypothetical protein